MKADVGGRRIGMVGMRPRERRANCGGVIELLEQNRTPPRVDQRRGPLILWREVEAGDRNVPRRQQVITALQTTGLQR
jgi:hypothetical protein